MSNETQKRYPLLPLRDVVVFPNMIVPLFVGRKASVKALEHAVNSDNKLVLVTQTSEEVDEVTLDSVHRVGVVATVLQYLKIPQGTIKVLVQGDERVRVTGWGEKNGFIEVDVEPHPYDRARPGATGDLIKKRFQAYAAAKKNIPTAAIEAVEAEKDMNKLLDLVAGTVTSDVQEKQAILEISSLKGRLKKLREIINKEISEIEISKDIHARVKDQLEQTQREHILTEQMKAIQRELGDDDDVSDFEELEMRIENTNFTDEARTKALSELKKLRTGNPNSPEIQVSRNYLEWLLDIPWGTPKKTRTNIKKAQRVLDRDHYGLKQVKERIIEFIAVQKRTGNIGGSILCLVGPPGVGKTSLGCSLAEATGREFLRISLGGIHDESEIRGHRRTYIGAMPGRIIKSFRKQKTTNPLILLDEIDKMANYRGDPASALLEVLDPEQNDTFYDNFLDVDYDLSQVLFITTANYMQDIPLPLLDRMDIINLDGYTEDEKVQIARHHLLPDLRKSNGLESREFSISNRVIQEVITSYTREAGVRSLKRALAKIMRKSVTRLERGDDESIRVKLGNLNEFLGMPKHRYKTAEKSNQIGVATGLAWTPAGGDLLSIEATISPGKGTMNTTGTLGRVMKESITAATSYVKSVAAVNGINPDRFGNTDIHIHVPEGATPKEGPSAGVGMVTAIISVLTGIPVIRSVAMTGEVTLRGNVLPIGGLKAKLLAAIRGRINTVIIPEENLRDLAEIPDAIKNHLTILPVSHMSEILPIALERKPEPLTEAELQTPAALSASKLVQPESGHSMSQH
ncbi:MAG: endopeptidase La [Rhodobacteraceae bacterium]|nr:endopeptidase La [Paracoccaceae bacterium]